MEPVISPAWVYLAHILNTIYGLTVYILIISLFAMIMSPFIADNICEDDEEEKKMTRRIIKICAVMAVIGIILLIFIPDKKTVYAMIAASVITPDNISISEDHIVDLISKIVEAVRNHN